VTLGLYTNGEDNLNLQTSTTQSNLLPNSKIYLMLF